MLVAPPEADVALKALRVCADPNNMPYSNRAGEGFENVLAEMVADHLNRRLTYVWWAQRRGFIGNTIGAGRCDLVMGVPTGFGMLSTSRPYYRSTYVFLTRTEDGAAPRSLDDRLLKTRRIGVHLIGDDYANTPGAHALGKREIRDNVVGFPIYGDYGKANPPARLVEAVADGTVDIAIVWGPFAGYFAPRQQTGLRMQPVRPAFDPPDQAFVFSISMGVRRGNFALRTDINDFIRTRSGDINRVLAEYDVPRLDGPRPLAAPEAAAPSSAAE